jgi:hypothetical protein
MRPPDGGKEERWGNQSDIRREEKGGAWESFGYILLLFGI